MANRLPPLMYVILPQEYYQVMKDGLLVWDGIGIGSYARNLGNYSGLSPDDAMFDSWYAVVLTVGRMIFWSDPEQGREFARQKMAQRALHAPVFDPQLFLKFGPSLMEEEIL